MRASNVSQSTANERKLLRQRTSPNQPAEHRKETPDGLWYKCPECKTVATMAEHKRLHYVCANCGHHDRIDASAYFELLFDGGQYTELDADLTSADPLQFTDTKPYPQRVQ